MKTRQLALTLVLAAFALPSLSFAQAQDEHRATVLLRNGDRVAGELEDVENGIVYVRVSLHDQRKLDLKNVALIDFVGGATGLPETELSKATGAAHLALLRDSTSWQGQMVDIRGGEEKGGTAQTLVFRGQDGQEHTVSLDRVSRIYLGNFPTATVADQAPTANEDVPAGSVRLPADTTWMATPVFVREGQQVRFNIDGQIQLSAEGDDTANPAGSVKQRRATGAPLPQFFAGAVIGKVGNSEPFAIGNNTAPITMPASGQLYLGINDDHVNDNRGAFVVKITPNPQ